MRGVAATGLCGPSATTVGSGKSLRLEHRLAGVDVNPYLALAAIVSAALQ
ncbi:MULTISPECIES: hypothetical protein [Mycolicibacterium]